MPQIQVAELAEEVLTQEMDAVRNQAGLDLAHVELPDCDSTGQTRKEESAEVRSFTRQSPASKCVARRW